MENFPFGHVNLAIILVVFFFFSAAINDRSTVGSGTLAATLFFFSHHRKWNFIMHVQAYAVIKEIVEEQGMQNSKTHPGYKMLYLRKFC